MLDPDNELSVKFKLVNDRQSLNISSGTKSNLDGNIIDTNDEHPSNTPGYVYAINSTSNVMLLNFVHPLNICFDR